jgi:hypothetical protein
VKVKNVSRFGDLEVPALGAVVKAGEVVEVTAGQGAGLLAQPDNWQHVETPRKGE